MRVLMSHIHWDEVFQMINRSVIRCSTIYWKSRLNLYFPLLFLSLLSESLFPSATIYTHFHFSPTAASDTTLALQLFYYSSTCLSLCSVEPFLSFSISCCPVPSDWVTSFKVVAPSPLSQNLGGWSPLPLERLMECDSHLLQSVSSSGEMSSFQMKARHGKAECRILMYQNIFHSFKIESGVKLIADNPGAVENFSLFIWMMFLGQQCH